MSVKALSKFFCGICSFAMLLLIIYGNIVDFGIWINNKPNISTEIRWLSQKKLVPLQYQTGSHVPNWTKQQRSLLQTKACRQYQQQVVNNSYTVYYNVLNELDQSTHKLCLITQLSMNRIDSLKRLAQAWQGPISASIYTPGENISAVIKNLTAWSQTKTIEWFNVNLITQQGVHYPVNVLRNIALRTAIADFIFHLDVDFVPSLKLFHTLHGYINDNFFSESQRALIVPEFAFDPNQNTSFPWTKEDAKRQFGNALRPFDFGNKYYRIEQAPTNFTKWLTTNKTFSTAAYQRYYEPYIVIRKSHLPEFDEHFVDRWYDKLSNILEIVNECSEMYVLADGFVAHIDHKRSSSKEIQQSLRCLKDTYWALFKNKLKQSKRGCLSPDHYNI